MIRTTLALTIAAALISAACLQKDTTSTIYLRQDGSFDWVILEQNVRSDGQDEASRLSEEAGYVDGISRGDTVALSGFGSFVAKERAARTGRNPRTGEPVAIAASRAPTFKAGKALKDALN